MKRHVTSREIGRLTELVTSFTWAITVQNAVQNHAFGELGLKTDSTEPRERWAAVQDMLHGDLTVLQAVKKLGIEIRSPEAPKPTRRKRTTNKP